MKRWILRVCIIFISMTLIMGIKKAYTQTINPDSFDSNIINILSHEIMVEDSGSPVRLWASSVNTRFKPLSQDEIWMLLIKATGQGDGVSTVTIGVDPTGKAYPYPFNPPEFTVVLKIVEDSNEYSEDIRVPGSTQEVWLVTVMMGGTTFGGKADSSQPGFFPVLSWDPNEIGAADVMELRMGDANGPVLADLTTTNTYQTKEEDISNPTVNYIPTPTFLSYALIEYAIVFEPASLYTTYYRDADGDGYGDPNDTIVAEELPPGYAIDPVDCDDSDPNTYPGALEICDTKDNDCDRVIDIKISDPNNLDLDIEGLKIGLNKILIKNFCTSYNSYDFLLNFRELLNIASLNSDKTDVTASFMSTYLFFGKICGYGFELSQDPLHTNLLYIY